MHALFTKLLSRPYFLLNVVYLAAGSLCGLIWYYLFSGHSMISYFCIVLFFWMMGVSVNHIINRTIQQNVGKLFAVYLTLRMAKFIVTVIFLAVFELFVMEDSHKLPFAGALMGNFVLYTFFEICTINLYNKRLVSNAKKK